MDKVTVENRGGAWINDRKTADWQDDYKGKMYVAKPGWHWLGIKEQTGENRPAFQVDLRPLDDDAIKQYCSDISKFSSLGPKRDGCMDQVNFLITSKPSSGWGNGSAGHRSGMDFASRDDFRFHSGIVYSG